MARSVPTISIRALGKLLALLPQLGLDARAVFAEIDLQPEQVKDADARVPLDRLYALWEIVLRRVPREDCALIGARSY